MMEEVEKRERDKRKQQREMALILAMEDQKEHLHRRLPRINTDSRESGAPVSEDASSGAKEKYTCQRCGFQFADWKYKNRKYCGHHCATMALTLAKKKLWEGKSEMEP